MIVNNLELLNWAWKLPVAQINLFPHPQVRVQFWDSS